MRPPSIPVLQLLNALVAFGSMFIATQSVSVWRGAGWSAWSISLVMALGNICYAGFVAQGGRLADRYGRARIGLVGAAIGGLGGLVAMIFRDPAAAVVGTMLGFGGPALFFPGCAGLFSDSQGASGGAPPPLHRKVSGYNLGWALGNFSAFTALGLLGSDPVLSYGVAAGAFFAVGAVLWRWRRLPPLPPPPEGDRAPHPALPRLTMMGRTSLFCACVLVMGMIALCEKALSGERIAGPAGPERTLASVLLACFSAGYIVTFLILGAWSGWVLRPWRLWACQVGLVVGTAGVFALGRLHLGEAWPLGICGLLIGLSYGATYTGSIFYSLRLPHGAARAASLHETYLGCGYTAGPLLCGLFLSGVGTDLASLGLFLTGVAVVCLGFQALVIPGAVKLGAR